MNLEIINIWFEKRFGRKPYQEPFNLCDNYYEEWIDRFKRLIAWDCMDFQSKKMFLNILENYK